MKKRMKTAVALLISAMLMLNTMVITPLTASAAAADELDSAAENQISADADFKYNVYEGKALINEYLGSDENIVIPEEIDGYEVTGLALFNWEPKDNISAVKSVVIPDTVTKIWFRCFQNFTSLETVTFGSHVESIGMCAFLGCSSLKEIELPDSVTDLQGGAFAQCSNLKKVKLSQNLTSIESGTFWKCVSLYDIVFPEKLKVIDGPIYGGAADEALIHGAFDSCSSLHTVTLPEGLEEIGAFAFYNSGMHSVSIPHSVKSISDYAFAYCSAYNVYISSNLVESISDYAFINCSVSNVFIPPTVENLSRYAFGFRYEEETGNFIKKEELTIFGCRGTAAEQYALDNEFDFIEIDKELSDKVLACGTTGACIWILTDKGKMDISPNSKYHGIRRSGDMMFYYYVRPEWSGYSDKINEVVFEDGVRRIGAFSFYDCTNLSKITIADSVTDIGDSVFINTAYYNEDTNWENDILYIDKWLIEARLDITGECIIREGTEHIADEAFSRFSGDYWTGCENLTKVVFPDSLKSIGYASFVYCSKLDEIVIPSNVKEISEWAFRDCEYLQSVRLSEGLEEIGRYAFYGCNCLRNITIPKTVSSISECSMGYGTDGKIEGFTIYGYPRTVAETYANENGFTFIPLDEPTEPVYVEKTDEKTGVSATVDEAVELKVDDVTDEASGNIEVFDGEEIFRVYAISLEKDGETVQPSEKVAVKIPCDNENAKVYRVENDNSLTDMNAEYENGYLIFETDHFSLYIVAVPETVKIGDVNGDGNITIDDVTLVQKSVAELETLTELQKTVADVNGDGEITIVDATMIQKYVAELIEDFG